MPRKPQPVFELVIASTPGGPDPTVRLRQVLRRLLRAYGFRAVSCRQLDLDLGGAPSVAQSGTGGDEVARRRPGEAARAAAGRVDPREGIDS
jgi:hypothetical protein